MSAIDLIMPMAGRGSRFVEGGFSRPKPLHRLNGRPFFWWAAESVCRRFDVRTMVFVILRKDVERHRLGQAILDHYPSGTLIILDEPTSGPLASTLRGCAGLRDDRWLIVSSCDHAFDATRAAAALPLIEADANAFFCYSSLDNASVTTERHGATPRSEHVVPGVFGVANRDLLVKYGSSAPVPCDGSDDDLAAFTRMLSRHGKTVRGLPVDRHVSFRNPEEYDQAPSAIADLQEVLCREKSHA